MKYIPNTPETRPTEPGFYWVKSTGPLGRQKEGVGEVYFWTPGSQGSVHIDGDTYTIDDGYFLAFAGPIPKPEE